jgi:(S)-sulfolactate dehydrogenase
MRIVITEFMDPPAVERLAARHDVLYDPKLVDDPPRLRAEAANADVLIVRNRTQVRGELLAAAAKCRIVGRLGVGLDNIDVAACEARGIRVIPATGANALSVAEYVIATAMLLLRGAYASTAQVAAGGWPRGALGNGRELGGKTLGLVGFGSIGQLTAKLTRALGLQVVAYDAMLPAADALYAERGVRALSFDELIATADVVSLHIPLVDSTRGLFDAARIRAMKPGAVLINTARGGIVDEIALADALKAGRLGGAAIDVFATEPLPASPHFDGCPNLILTPHIAGVSTESNERVSFMIADKVLEALS